MENFKSGFVAVIGKTNVGKSSIINRLVGEKVSAIANKPQTTRTRIKGIVNRPNSQIIFLDTPGLHKSKSKLGNVMVENAIASILEADIVLYVIDASEYKNINNLSKNGENKESKILENAQSQEDNEILEDTQNQENKTQKVLAELKKEDQKVIEKIKEANKKTILIINKIDLVDKEKLANIINLYKDLFEFKEIIQLYIKREKNVEDILTEIERNLSKGPAYYDTEEYTDQTLRQLAEETIREKALKLLQNEVPHGILVEVNKMKSRKTKDMEKIYDIESTIFCLRESHKGIIIGKNGSMLKTIGTYAREDLEKMLDTKVNLKLWVKVKKDWINDMSIVKKFKAEE